MVKKRNEAGARGLSPEGSAAEAKRMRRQTAKDDRARRRRTGGTPSRAQGGRQRAGGAVPRRRRRSPKGLPFLLRQASPGPSRTTSPLNIVWIFSSVRRCAGPETLRAPITFRV